MKVSVPIMFVLCGNCCSSPKGEHKCVGTWEGHFGDYACVFGCVCTQCVEGFDENKIGKIARRIHNREKDTGALPHSR